MIRTPMWLGLGILLLGTGSYVASSILESPPEGDLAAVEPAAPLLVEPVAPPSSPRAAATPPTPPARTPSPSAPPVPIEKLLELPGAPSAKPKSAPAIPSRAAADAAPDKALSDRVQVEAARTRDRPTVRPDQASERLDVGVSVGVDGTTRLRGGVRIESGADETREPSRTPVLGIEKRF